MENNIAYILLALVAIAVQVVILRAVFSIGAITRNLRAQTELLTKIAEDRGIVLNETVGIPDAPALTDEELKELEREALSYPKTT